MGGVVFRHCMSTVCTQKLQPAEDGAASRTKKYSEYYYRTTAFFQLLKRYGTSVQNKHFYYLFFYLISKQTSCGNFAGLNTGSYGGIFNFKRSLSTAPGVTQFGQRNTFVLDFST
jgi:hypothetical protein